MIAPVKYALNIGKLLAAGGAVLAAIAKLETVGGPVDFRVGDEQFVISKSGAA